MTSSILVLADLSAAAEQAARYAAALAQPLGQPITLLHLLEMPRMTAPELVAAAAALAGHDEADAAAGLHELALLLPGPAQVLLGGGLPHEALREALQSTRPLLLAIGWSPNDNGLDHLLPTLRATQWPLLLVPATAHVLPVLPRRVVLAADGEKFCLNRAAHALTPLLAAWPASYTLIHINANDEPCATAAERIVRSDVEASHLLPAGSRPDMYVEDHRDPATGILEALVETEADLLILIARPRSFLSRHFRRSVTARVLRRSPVPVLLLPALY